MGNNVYEGDKVQYLLTGNGRTTFDPASGLPKEEFFVKDHLGNVRSVVDVYTYLIQQYLATYELASANLENLFFEDVDEVRDDRPGSTWNGDLKSARLNGADPERRVGTSMLMHVMAGDKVELNVNNYYEGYDAEEDSPLDAEEMLSSIINTLVQGPGGTLPGEGHDVNLVEEAFNWPNFEKFHQLTAGVTDPSKPKAYLNYILFDEQMRMVNTASGAFQANGNGSWTQIGTTAPMEIPANGYLAVYLSNSSRMGGCLACSDVFFDQLVVRMTRGKLKEESHYYPFGLPMAGMGSAAAGFKENRRKYQSNEYIKDFGLNWMDFQARQYDPQLGRFLAVDPLAESTDDMSPYTAMNNDPASMVDPDGLYAGTSFASPQEAFQFAMSMNSMFGADNWSLGEGGRIMFQNLDAAKYAFEDFLSSGAGGGCFATGETMSFIGTQILASHNSITNNIEVGWAGNSMWVTNDGGSIGDVVVEGKQMSDWDRKGAIIERGRRIDNFDGFAGTLTAIWGGRSVDGIIYNSDGYPQKIDLMIGGSPPVPSFKGGSIFKLAKFFKKPPLPSLDGTGKVHGILPKVKDLAKYSVEELKVLLEELKHSVPQRINSTVKSGPTSTSMQNRSHGQRQGAEQDLIKSIEKILGE